SAAPQRALGIDRRRGRSDGRKGRSVAARHEPGESTSCDRRRRASRWPAGGWWPARRLSEPDSAIALRDEDLWIDLDIDDHRTARGVERRRGGPELSDLVEAQRGRAEALRDRADVEGRRAELRRATVHVAMAAHHRAEAAVVEHEHSDRQTLGDR